MDNKKVFTQVFDYQKMMFDNAFAIMSNVQDQSEKLLNMAVEKNPMIPNDTLRTISYWSDFFKKNRANYKSYVDTHIDKVKGMFDVVAPASSKTDAPANN
ncbi:conserved hypothetical protein [Desulfamplus magnetovallimortis]|uniref:Phasin domain-containing protein n=1 Tax=Desulfamplus magnetovallimortis TaxID=1246637 RepID=A0A1W1H6R5_9BACT|nr:hypothetical protein [Desulfamplus magnetovallimortis]SLM28163.1 conserved hypothetical protein [Desulfamplus magnetovallimortis]